MLKQITQDVIHFHPSLPSKKPQPTFRYINLTSFTNHNELRAHKAAYTATPAHAQACKQTAHVAMLPPLHIG